MEEDEGPVDLHELRRATWEALQKPRGLEDDDEAAAPVKSPPRAREALAPSNPAADVAWDELIAS